MKCNHNSKVLILTIAVVSFSLLAMSELGIVNGLPANVTNTSKSTNLTKLFQDKYSRNYTSPQISEKLGEEITTIPLHDVVVRYESPTTILISGYLRTPFENVFNSYLWQAMDLLKKQYGFKLQQVMTSGDGSGANPTTVYILMTK